MSLSSLVIDKKQDGHAGFYLKRKLILLDETDLEVGIMESRSYIDYKRLFALDKEFQKKKWLLNTTMEKGENYSLVVRRFSSDQARAEWIERFDKLVLKDPQKMLSFNHHYEIEQFNV